MILPTKHLSQERALLTVGGRIIYTLAQPKTVSAVWIELGSQTPYAGSIRYDHFVLALDLLYLMGAVDLTEGILNLRKP